MADTDEDVEVCSAPGFTTPTIWQRLSPIAIVIALIALAMSIWAVVSASANDADTVALPGNPKVRVCNAFDMVVRAVALQTRTDLSRGPNPPAAGVGNTGLALVGGGDYLLRQLDADTPAHLADAVRAFARDLQEIGMNTLAGGSYNDPRQAARQAEGEFDRKQVEDLCA
ncbi:hypothetical protein ORI20_10595 [Mycobacterium sp. CVI_P3]|uniref:Alanine and proline rich membrane protein n=1 Tax=Mycobacterium pinniadriaticum TaxID=2994102 RepID=A0ABT3SCN9_9MYCO|nr:hypothetical protein [Mycobacterium pinniadriaticum]MCX2930728.1 hypothetical protein [Mycobacterium pinniadriaticum]MCX2937152.1 hypothetical protein [Mycobacterium pinniadriaticum]